MDAATAMTTYNLNMSDYVEIANWVGGWLTSQTSLPLILLVELEQ